MSRSVGDSIGEPQDAEHAGKATGRDVAAGKLACPSVQGLEASRAEVDRLLREARDAASSFGRSGAGLASFAEELASRTR